MAPLTTLSAPPLAAMLHEVFSAMLAAYTMGLLSFLLPDADRQAMWSQPLGAVCHPCDVAVMKRMEYERHASTGTT